MGTYSNVLVATWESQNCSPFSHHLYSILRPLDQQERVIWLEETITRLIDAPKGKRLSSREWESLDSTIAEMFKLFAVAVKDELVFPFLKETEDPDRWMLATGHEVSSVVGKIEPDMRKVLAEKAIKFWLLLPAAQSREERRHIEQDEDTAPPVLDLTRKLLLSNIGEDWYKTQSETDAAERWIFLMEVIGGKFGELVPNVLRRFCNEARLQRLLVSIKAMETLDRRLNASAFEAGLPLLAVPLIKKLGADPVFLMAHLVDLLFGDQSPFLNPQVVGHPALTEAVLGQVKPVKALDVVARNFENAFKRSYNIEIKELKVKEWHIAVNLTERQSYRGDWRDLPQDTVMTRLVEWGKTLATFANPAPVSVTFTRHSDIFVFHISRQGEVTLISGPLSAK